MKRLFRGEAYRHTGYAIARVRYWDVSPRHSPLASFGFWENYFGAMAYCFCGFVFL
ncbi:MAG: hypothetical protein LBJ00_05045 [Planctomycetaceae bacterium]|nr:hypothetical protein [Planctomycetaceae bacterium]